MDFLRKLFGLPTEATTGPPPPDDVAVPPALAFRPGPGDRYVPDHDYDHALYLDTLEGQALRDFLDRHVSPAVEPLGLAWQGDYRWVGESVGGVRKVLDYAVLRGRGAFKYGVCLDFVKLASGNKLVFNRTARSARLHLFERAPGYAETFRGLHIADAEGLGVVCHARCRAEHTLTRSLAYLREPIGETFERMGTVEGVILEARRQVEAAADPCSIYGMHSPPPALVLAFCYGEVGRHVEALAMLAGLRDLNESYRLDLVDAYLRKRAGA